MASQIPSVCKKLYKKNLIAGSDGNISEKIKDQIFITPSGVDKSEIQEKDLCVIGCHGKTLKGQPSSEKYMHLAIYKCQDKAKAIVHAHPPSVIALSLARPDWKILPPALPEIIMALGEVPFIPYITPGTEALGESLKPFVKNSRALILAHHGAVVWGESLEEAGLVMEQLEHSCKILCIAESMGKTNVLAESEVKKLLKY